MKYVLILLLVVSINAFAEECQITGANVGFTGLDGGDSRVYANISNQTTSGCTCSYIRFLPSRADTDKVLSLLLAARFSGKTVQIDLEDTANCNSAYSVYVE